MKFNLNFFNVTDTIYTIKQNSVLLHWRLNILPSCLQYVPCMQGERFGPKWHIMPSSVFREIPSICCLSVPSGSSVSVIAPDPNWQIWVDARMLMILGTFSVRKTVKLSLINNMALIIGIFNCIVTYAIVKGKPPDTWKLFFNYWSGF